MWQTVVEAGVVLDAAGARGVPRVGASGDLDRV